MTLARLFLSVLLALPASLAVAQDGYRIIAQGFESAGAAHRGVVPLMQGGLWGLMDGSGAWVVPPTLEAVGAAGDGKFAVKSAAGWGLVSTSGQMILDFGFEEIATPGPLTAVRWEGRWWVLNANGTFQEQPLALDTLTGSNGECFTGTSGGVPVIETRGAFPTVGQPLGVSEVALPSDGWAVVTLTDGTKTQIDCTQPSFDDSFARFEESRRVKNKMVAVRQDGLWGMYSIFDSAMVVPPKYLNMRDFADGLAAVQVEGGKWGYVDAVGRMQIAPQFDNAFAFNDGLAGVTMGEKRGFIRYDGSFAIAPQFDDFWRHEGGIVAVQTGPTWSVIGPDATNPQTRFDLPLAAMKEQLATRPVGTAIVPSSPHAYFAQDIVSQHTIHISPDQSIMLTVLSAPESQEVALWDFQSKKLIRKLNVPGVTQAVLLPGTEILMVGTNAGEVMALDAVTGQVMVRFAAHDGAVQEMVLSPDGNKLATSSMNAARIWDMTSGKMLVRHQTRVEKLRFARDSASLWLGNRRGGLVRLGLDGTALTEVPDGPAVEGEDNPYNNVKTRPDLALSPDGLLAVLRVQRVQKADGLFEFFPYAELTDATGARREDRPENLRDVLAIDLSDDGRLLALAGSAVADYSTMIVVRDLAASKAISTERLNSVGGGEGEDPGVSAPVAEASESGTGIMWVDRLAFVPGGADLVVVGGEGGNIVLFDPLKNLVRDVIGQPLAKSRLVALPDSTRLFTSDGNGQILIWDFDQGRLEMRLPNSIAGGGEEFMGTDGANLYLADGFDETRFEAWDLATLTPVQVPSFNPYDPATEATLIKPRPVPPAMADTLTELGASRFTPVDVFAGGRLAVIAQSSGLMTIHAAETGDVLAYALADEAGEWVVLTPEGFFAASENGAKLVSVSTGLRAVAVDQVYQALYRPDLVRAKLAGDPDGKVQQAAAGLDLSSVLGSGPAPVPRFVFPKDGATISNEEVEVGAEVRDAGGGVGRVEWRLNGVTVDVRPARGLAAVGDQAAAADTPLVQTKLALEPGENRIEVVVYNAAGLVASAPQVLTLTWDGVASLVPPALHVLSVGVNAYQDGRLRLTYAADDAKAIAAAVEKAGTGMFSQVNAVTLLDGQVTRAGLDAAFADMAAKVKPQDVFIFFLAGHGKTVEGEYHFIPVDFRFEGDDPVRKGGIAQDQWQAWMAGIRARKSIMIYDTCESGSLTGTRGLEAALAQSAAVERLTRAMGRSILSAATDDAPALEGYNGHGVMTYALLEALDAADTNGNATIEVTELAGFVDQKVPEYSQAAFGYRQVPQMSLKGSDFALGAKVSVLKGAVERFPETLTHVVTGGSAVLDAPGGATVTVIDAGAFFGVFLIEEKDGFARVAKDGLAIGWVPLASLGKLQ